MLDGTTIRPASARDAEVLARLGADTFTETFGHLYAPEDLAAFLATAHSPQAVDALLHRGSAAWLALDQTGAPIAYAIAGPCKLPVEPRPASAGELSRLYVAKGYQGAGLGVALLDVALTWLTTWFEEIFLSVYSENEGAQRLYGRYGFEIIQEYEFMVGNHADREFIMRLTQRKTGASKAPALST